MNYATIDIKLRPIKIAFLVPHNDKKALLEAIEYNSLLWGGQFNPIIPVYKRRPKLLVREDPFLKYATKESYLEGFIERFDPDYVLLLGDLKRSDIDIQDRKFIFKGDLLDRDNYLSYGISIFNILNDLYDKEFKFIRKNPIKVLSPQYSTKDSLFMSAVFGQLPKDLRETYAEWESELSADKKEVTTKNYITLMEPDNLFLRRLSSIKLNVYGIDRFNQNSIFIMDSKSSLDILDYWNLRALGRNVLPVVIDEIGSESILQIINGFIDKSKITPGYNKRITYNATIVKSRTLTKDQFDKALKVIKRSQKKPGSLHVSNYPSLWEKRLRIGRADNYPTLESTKTSHTITNSTLDIRIKSIDPKFMMENYASNNPRYANVIKFSIYSSDDLRAEVLPHTNFNRGIYSALTLIGLDRARLSREGLVLFRYRPKDSDHLRIPLAQDIFFSWLKTQKIDAETSKPGKIAYQLLNNLGVTYGIDLIADGNLLRLIGELSKGKGFSNKDQLGQKLYEVSQKSSAIMPITSQGLLNRLLDAKALELGIETECPVCSRQTWFSIEGIVKKITCKNCLGEFGLPRGYLDKLKWSYRILGPFASKDKAQGSFSVLLTVRVFKNLLNMKVTPALNFLYKFRGSRNENEIDLGMLVEDRAYSSLGVVPLFAECKSFGSIFTENDISKTLALVRKVPGSIAVFATFRTELTDPEKKKLNKRLISIYKRRLKGDYHDLIVLTGTELFGKDSLRNTWEKATEDHKTHANSTGLEELANATKKLYLDAPSYEEWIDQNRAKLFKKK